MESYSELQKFNMESYSGDISVEVAASVKDSVRVRFLKIVAGKDAVVSRQAGGLEAMQKHYLIRDAQDERA